ncbi:hypothetical protein INR49_019002 [Caranx melampygus]|nr:hypothetical protein INR49_019002 [Caranx melampygus]
MGAVLSWATARFCSLLLDTAEALRRWRVSTPHQALEDSPCPSSVLEGGGLGADSLEWCERSIGGGDTSDEYFDSRSWHSDTLSDLTPDGEESLVTPLGPEDACDGQRAVGGGFLCGQSKARRRDGHRDAPDTHGGQNSCSRRRSPETHPEAHVPSKFSSRHLGSEEPRPPLSKQEVKVDVEREQWSLQTVLQSQHSTQVNTPDTQELRPEHRAPPTLKESQTCCTHTHTVHTSSGRHDNLLSCDITETLTGRDRGDEGEGCGGVKTQTDLRADSNHGDSSSTADSVKIQRSDVTHTHTVCYNTQSLVAHSLTVDTCPQTRCEDTRSRHPQVCSVTWPQGEAESGGVVVTPPGTVNEICSSITFSTETTAAPVLSHSGRDLTQTQGGRLRPQQVPGPVHNLACDHHDQVGATETAPHRQLHAGEDRGCGSVGPGPGPGPDSSQSKAEECWPPPPLSHNLLFLSGSLRAEETSPVLSGGVAVGSPCSFHNIRGRGEEWGGRAVCLDQITGSKVSVSEQSELRVLHPETVSPQRHPGNITSTQTNQDTGGGDPSGGHRGFSPCGPAPGRLCKTSLSLLSDSNNNNKDGTEGGQRGEGSVCLSGGAHSCDTGDEEIIHPLVEPSTALTYDLLGDVEQLRGDSEVSLSSLDHGWSQEVSTSLESVELRCVRSSCPQVYSEATGDGGGNFESEHPTSKPIQVWGVRGCPPDVSLHLPSVRSLEPIWEAGHETMRPAEDSGDVSNLDMSSPEGQRNRSPPTAEEGLEVNIPVLRAGGEKQCRPVTVAYDAVCYTSASSTCEELDPHSALDKMIKRSKTKGSKFSVFAKMPSFRKTRGLKGSKSEEASPEGGGEGPLSEQGPHRDNYDDEVFIRGDILNQSVHQAFTSTPYEGEDKDCGLFSSTTHTCHVRQVWGGSEREAGGYSSDTSLLKQIQSPNSHSYKRSKSSDSLNIRMRFAQAHKSLSSLFESRPTDKEQEDQVSMGSDLDSAKNRQTWRRLKKAKEAELLKRTQSVPDRDSAAAREDQGHFTSSPVLDRLGILGSPSSIQTLRHTDPISKRGVPQRGGKDSPHGCRSEGQRRKCPPNGLPAGLCPFSDDSAVPRPATPVQRHFGARPLISIHLPGLGPTQWPVRAWLTPPFVP